MIYAFTDCELDTLLFELRRAGRLCRLEPQTYDVLLYLIQLRDRVVLKEELLARCWSDRCVTDSTLSHYIKEARQVVGDDGHTQRVIKTYHRRGYRFVAQVLQREVWIRPRNATWFSS